MFTPVSKTERCLTLRFCDEGWRAVAQRTFPLWIWRHLMADADLSSLVRHRQTDVKVGSESTFFIFKCHLLGPPAHRKHKKISERWLSVHLTVQYCWCAKGENGFMGTWMMRGKGGTGGRLTFKLCMSSLLTLTLPESLKSFAVENWMSVWKQNISCICWWDNLTVMGNSAWPRETFGAGCRQGQY